IADAKETGAGLEIIAEGESTKGGVASGTATVDHCSVAVDLGPRRQKLRAVYAIINIDNTPIVVQALAIGSAITSTAAIVNVKYANAATGPVLDRKHEHGNGGCRGSAMTFHQE